MEKEIEKFKEFLGKFKSEDTVNSLLLETIQTGFVESIEKPFLEAKEKWSKDVHEKKGKMHTMLGLKQGDKISDHYESGEALAKKLLTKGSKQKISSMLNFSVNVSKNPDPLLKSALAHIKKEDKDEK